jgi:hypothetical protein
MGQNDAARPNTADGRDAAADDRLPYLHELDLIHVEDKSGEIVFKHALVRDALYDSMLNEQRASLHA